MKISEVFTSIEGEGLFAGRPAVFVRTYGCSLNCAWCDTKYANEGGKYDEMTTSEIVNKVLDTGIGNVTITGGEPLLQTDIAELVKKLRMKRINVNIETAGSVDISTLPFLGRATISMDYKLPSSGMMDKMVISNFRYLSRYDVLKFVAGSAEDLAEAKNVIELYRPICRVFVSPVFGMIKPEEIVDWLIKNRYSTIRLSLQLHKIVGVR